MEIPGNLAQVKTWGSILLIQLLLIVVASVFLTYIHLEPDLLCHFWEVFTGEVFAMLSLVAGLTVLFLVPGLLFLVFSKNLHLLIRAYYLSAIVAFVLSVLFIAFCNYVAGTSDYSPC